MSALDQLKNVCRLSLSFDWKDGGPIANGELLCGEDFVADLATGDRAVCIVQMLGLIRDHGPAIVELIEADVEEVAAHEAWLATPTSHFYADKYKDALRRMDVASARRMAAIKKLTATTDAHPHIDDFGATTA